MATYKVKATMILDIEVEVDAVSEDCAIRKFIRMDARDAIDEGHIGDVNTEFETAELVAANYKVRVSNIDYDVDDEVSEFIENQYGITYESPDYEKAFIDERAKVLRDLPTEVVVELKYCAPEDVESEAIDEVSNETGWLINSADVEILEAK